MKEARIRNADEYPRNKKYTCKGPGVDDHGAYEEMKKSHCSWGTGPNRASGRDEVEEVQDTIGLQRTN